MRKIANVGFNRAAVAMSSDRASRGPVGNYFAKKNKTSDDILRFTRSAYKAP